MKISEIITNKYKLRIPPTVYYDLLADVQEAEEAREPILDKIRAEIESMDFDFGDYYDHTSEIIEMVCKAIDKYKAEMRGEKK